MYIQVFSFLSYNISRKLNVTDFCIGIQPTGDIHIGNYLGAIKKWIELQNCDNDVILSIADMHAITLHQVKFQIQLY